MKAGEIYLLMRGNSAYATESREVAWLVFELWKIHECPKMPALRTLQMGDLAAQIYGETVIA